MKLNNLAAIYRLAQELEILDGAPNAARLQHLRDFIGRFELSDDTMAVMKERAEQMREKRAFLLLKELNKEEKLEVTYLLANIACTDDQLTEKGRGFVTKIVLECNLPIPGAEDQWQEVIHDNSPEASAPITPGYILIAPNGLASLRTSEHEDWRSLSKDLVEWIGAERTEVVRYTAPLNEISARLRLKGRHLVFVVDRNGRASGAGDNMTGTLLYGGGSEIYGNIVLALETDEGYRLEGGRNITLMNDILAAVNDSVDYLLWLEED